MAGRRRFETEHVLEQVMVLFWQQGFAATSVDDVSAATGLGRGSLYHAFGGKDALFVAALQRYGDRYTALYDAALSPVSDGAAVLVSRFLGVTTQRLLDPALPSGCMIAESVAVRDGLSPQASSLATALLDSQRRRVHEALTGARAANVGVATELVITVNQGLAVLGRAGASGDRLQAVVDGSLQAVAALTR